MSPAPTTARDRSRVPADHAVRLVYFVAFFLTTTSWSPLLVGGEWYLAAMIVCFTAAACAQLADSLAGNRWIGPGVSAIVGLVILSIQYTDATLLPTPESVRSFVLLMREGIQVVNTTPSPVVTGNAVSAMIVSALFGLWWVGDVIAVAMRYPSAGGLALLAVYCVPSSILLTGVPTIWFTVSAAGLVLLLTVGNRDRLTAWGRQIDPRPVAAGAERVSRALAVVAGSFVLALLIPSLLPGLKGGLITELRGQNRTGSSALSTNLDLRRDLTRNTDRPLIRYTTSAANPGPLRMFTVSSLQGDRWEVERSDVADRVQAADSALNPPGAGSNPKQENLSVTTVGLRQRYLPVPAKMRRFKANEGNWQFDAQLGTLLGRDASTASLNYDVSFSEAAPDAKALASPGNGSNGRPPSVAATYLAVPQDTPDVLARTAIRVAGEGTDYVKAQRLQSYFRSGGRFTYSTEVDDSTSVSAMATFLQDRRGYCVHFATAMTLMARDLGIPARVVVGLLPGRKDGDEWVASERDAHAWPELYFAGAGWVRFEPTPAGRTGTAPQWTVQDSTTPEPTTSATSEAPSATETATAAAEPTPTTAPGQDEQTNGTNGLRPTVPWILGLATLVLLACLPSLGAALVRRHRRTHAVDPDEAAWRELVERLSDLGTQVDPAASVRRSGEHIARALHSEDARQALQRRVQELEHSRYAAPPSGTAVLTRGSRTASADVLAVTRDASTHVRRQDRLLARWFPRAVFRRGEE